MKKILSSLLAVAVIAGLLPMAAMTASADCLASNVYANDFESMITAPSGDYQSVGGWYVYSTAGLADGRDGGSSLCVSSAPGKAAETASKGCYYCLAPENRMKTGLLNVNFDFNIGSNVSTAGVYFHSIAGTSGKGAITTTKSGNTVSPLELQTLTGGTGWTLGAWYNADITIDLDARTWTVRVLNPDGTVYKGYGARSEYTETVSGKKYGETLALIEFVSKSNTAIVAGSNTDTSAPNGMRIDNLSIRHYDGSLIYSNDFETQEQKPRYVSGQWEAGGLSKEGTSEFIEGGYNGSAWSYGFVHADTTTSSGINGGEYYIPNGSRHDNGIYKVTFCVRPGNKTQELYFPFNDTDTWNNGTNQDTGTITVDGTTIKPAHWYRAELTVNLDAGSYDLSLYDLEESGYPRVFNNTGSTSKKFHYIALREKTSNTGTMASGDGPRMDNLEVHYYGYGRIEGEDFDYGYITNKWESGDKLGSGKWGLSGSADFVAGGINGSTYALAPVLAPGTGSSTGSTEYWLPADEISTMGQYRISFWFRCGTGVNNMYLFASGIDEFNLTNSRNLSNLYDNTVMPKGQWYHADAVIDLDLHRYNIRFHDQDGNLVKQTEDTYSGDNYNKVTYFGWRCEKSGSALTAETCPLIDDVYITHNSAAVDETRVREDHGITFGSTTVIGTVRVFNDLWMSGSANQKKYQTFLGVYDADGDLVGFYTGNQKNCSVNDYYSSVVTATNSDFEDDGQGLTFRLFTWDYSNNNAIGKMVERVKPVIE